MSKTDRNEKTMPREREFPYIPRGVPILQVGAPYSAADNQWYVRSLHEARHPDLSLYYNEAIDARCGSGCKAGRGRGGLQIVPTVS
jgi:hypothetical protein